MRCTESADAFAGYADDFFDYDDIDLMFRLTAMLMACDATRVASLMIGAATPSRVYRELGHELNHHVLVYNGDEDWIRKTADVDYAEASFLVQFLDELAGRTDAVGASLLDDTLVMYGSGMGDGSARRAMSRCSTWATPVVGFGPVGTSTRRGARWPTCTSPRSARWACLRPPLPTRQAP